MLIWLFELVVYQVLLMGWAPHLDVWALSSLSGRFGLLPPLWAFQFC